MYTPSMFWIKNKENMYTFYYIKVRFKGVLIALTCLPDDFTAVVRGIVA